MSEAASSKKTGPALPGSILRVTADNPGPMTFRGTNSYVFGNATFCCIIDPGPDLDDHLEALEGAVGKRTVEAILLTHRHGDHSGLVEKTLARFGAPLLAAPSPAQPYQASVDFERLHPERALLHGERLVLAGHALEVVATPGHTSDHVAFSMPDHALLFSGDHVMGWSTTVVIPPDGSMRSYRESLRLLLERDEQLFLPGHGDAIERPHRLMRSFLAHRGQREEMIRRELGKGPATVSSLVERLYPDIGVALAVAAGFSVKAHLVEMIEDGTVLGSEPIEGDGTFVLK